GIGPRLTDRVLVLVYHLRNRQCFVRGERLDDDLVSEVFKFPGEVPEEVQPSERLFVLLGELVFLFLLDGVPLGLDVLRVEGVGTLTNGHAVLLLERLAKDKSLALGYRGLIGVV